jgi:single-strand DNA-binding protein
MNLNKVFILGRVTANPELRKTPGGQSVTSFSIATNRVWSDKAGAKQEEVEFTNVVVWGRQAEIATQFLVKGSLVLVEGRLKTRSWQDKQGQSRKATEVIAERIQLGPRPMGSGQSAGGPSKENASSKPEDIPVITIEEGGEESGLKAEDLPF